MPSFYVGLTNTIGGVPIYHVMKTLLFWLTHGSRYWTDEKVVVTSQEEQKRVETGIVSPRGSTTSIVLSLIRFMEKELVWLNSSAGSRNPTLSTDG